MAFVTDETDLATLICGQFMAGMLPRSGSLRPRIDAIDDSRSGYIVPESAGIAKKFIPPGHTFSERASVSVEDLRRE